ncbi:hypothetical protein [Falsiroseomonas selenitidurans]|uniref:Uncharacterized protein n=1 Tax=Falsiroseomonas selenitidurans TaxID=2716335 RepID=A0ABX1DWI6_9PROT|nr:hypothetical protein [Falsiroseomonas selenitidurans]NKC29279.1 hypothetical protein [Falsiroseomonas selenitidurans]
MSSVALSDIRAQRAEVEARLAYAHARDAEGKVLAWWRLHLARQARLAALGADGSARLPALPDPPPGALSRWQAIALRMRLMRLDSARPAGRVMRQLG